MGEAGMPPMGLGTAVRSPSPIVRGIIAVVQSSDAAVAIALRTLHPRLKSGPSLDFRGDSTELINLIRTLDLRLVSFGCSPFAVRRDPPRQP